MMQIVSLTCLFWCTLFPIKLMPNYKPVKFYNLSCIGFKIQAFTYLYRKMQFPIEESCSHDCSVCGHDHFHKHKHEVEYAMVELDDSVVEAMPV